MDPAGAGTQISSRQRLPDKAVPASGGSRPLVLTTRQALFGRHVSIAFFSDHPTESGLVFLYKFKKQSIASNGERNVDEGCF